MAPTPQSRRLTAPKGRPTPAQGSRPARSPAAEDRLALLQWVVVLGVILAVAVVLVVALGPGDGAGVGYGGRHGG